MTTKKYWLIFDDNTDKLIEIDGPYNELPEPPYSDDTDVTQIPVDLDPNNLPSIGTPRNQIV